MGRAYRQRHRRKTGRREDQSTDGYALANLAQFCASHGCQEVKHLRSYDFAGSGRGLQTLTSIKPGDSIIRIPTSLLITTSVALKDDDIKQAVQRSNLKPSSVELLSAFLLYERQKGDNSYWYHYIHSVPICFTTPLCMHTADLVLLDQRLQNEFHTMQSNVERTFSNMKCIFGGILGVVSYTDYLWAWHVVNTRCIYMEQPSLDEVRTSSEEEDDFALAPFLDLLNHCPYSTNTLTFDPDSGCYDIITRNSYKKYDQVFLKYGSHGNRTLLLEYGFCISNKTDEFVEFNIECVIKYISADCAVDAILEKLKERKLTQGLLCDYPEGMSWNLLNAIKLVCDSSGVDVTERVGRARVLSGAVDDRLSILQKTAAVRSTEKRSSDELFTLDMLTVLYEEEISILRNAVQYI